MYKAVEVHDVKLTPSQAIQPVDWHRADIIAAVRKSGTTIAALSRNAGLAPNSLSNVFYRKWPKGEKIISTHLQIDPAIIWPSRYGH